MLSAAYSERATSSGVRSFTEPATTSRSRTSSRRPGADGLRLVGIQLVAGVHARRPHADGRSVRLLGELLDRSGGQAGPVGRHDVLGDEAFRALLSAVASRVDCWNSVIPAMPMVIASGVTAAASLRALMPAVRPGQEAARSQATHHRAQHADPDAHQERREKAGSQDRRCEDPEGHRRGDGSAHRCRDLEEDAGTDGRRRDPRRP